MADNHTRPSCAVQNATLTGILDQREIFADPARGCLLIGPGCRQFYCPVALSPIHVRLPYAASFSAKSHTAHLDLGNIAIVVDHEFLEVARTPALIRRSDPAVYYLMMSYRGEQQLASGRSVTLLPPGDMVLMHTSLPIYSESDHRVRRQRGATFLVEPSVVPGRAHELDKLVGQPLSGRDVLVSLVARHVFALGTGRFRTGEFVQLASITNSLVALMLARHLDAEHALPPQTRDEALYARIKQFILTRLGDPRLDADSIAAAHHISTRTLHRLFRANEISVAAWIRELRLDHCRADLLNPRLADRPVRSIALEWGFSDPTHFSRTFKATYGLSPAALRAVSAKSHRPVNTSRRSDAIEPTATRGRSANR